MVAETSGPRTERRRYPRVHLQAPAIIVSPGEVQTFSLENIGAGGAFLKGQPAPPVGTEVRIEFAVTRGHHFSVSGSVIRHDSGQGGGFAVVFKATAAERERIASTLTGK